MAGALEHIRGGLIVALQADERSVLNAPAVVGELARCAERNGAAAVRVYGVDCIVAACASARLPVIGLTKREHDGFEPYMTTTLEEVGAVADAGAAIIAFDATDRARAGGATVDQVIAEIHARGKLAHADCSTLTDARHALAAGADVVATTLAGYTSATLGRPLPALDLVRAFRALDAFVVAEGAILTTEEAGGAFAAGADAICVGTAITDVDRFVRQYADVARRAALLDRKV